MGGGECPSGWLGVGRGGGAGEGMLLAKESLVGSLDIHDLIARGLTPVQAAALDAVTKRNDEDYDAFIRRASENALGRAVKILDLNDNSDLSRIALPTDQDRARVEKYNRALHLLLSS